MAGPGGIEAGRAAVIVLPDTSRFAASLKKYLERVERTARFEVPVTGDTSGLDEKLKKTREKARATPVSMPVQAQTDEFLRSARAAALKASKSVQADIPLTADGENLRRDLASQVESLERLTSLTVPLDLGMAANFRADVLAQVEEIERIAEAAAPKVNIAADVEDVVPEVVAAVEKAERLAPTVHIKADVDQSKSALIARITSQVSDLASHAAGVARILLTWGPPIIGALAGLVAMAPAVAILLPLVAGFGLGIGVVIASVARLKTEFKPVGEAIKALRKPISQAFTAGLGPIAQKLATNLIPQLKSGLVGVAQVMNTAATGVLKFTSSAQGVKLIKTLFDGLKPALMPLAAAVTPLTRALLQLSVAALPGLRLFSQGLAGVITKFAAFIAQASKSGSLAAGISKAVGGTGALLAGLGNFLGPLAKGLAMIGPSVLTGLGSAFTTVGGAITAIVGQVQELAPSFAAAGSAIKPLGALLTSVVAVVRAQIGFVVAAARQLAPSFQPFVAVLGAVASYIASSIGPAFATLRGALTPVIAGFQQFLNAVGPQLMPTFTALKAVIDALAPTIGKFAAQIGAVLGPGLAQIGQIIGTQLLPAFQAILPVVTPVVNFLLNVLGNAVVGALKGAINVIKGLLTVISGIFNTFAGIFTGDWSKAWQGIKQIFSGAFTAILGAIQVFLNVGVIRLFRLGVTGTIAAFRAIGPGLLAVGRGAMGLLESAISAGFSIVIGLAKAAPGRVLAGLRALGPGLGSLARAAWNLFKTAVISGTAAITTFVASIPGKVVAALGNVGSLLFQAGRDLVTGMINGLKSMAGALASAAGAMAGNAVSAAKKKLHIGSPSKVFHQIGRWTAQGFANGIAADSKLASDAVKKLATELSKNYASGLRSGSADVKKAGSDLVALVRKSITDFRDDKAGLGESIDRETTAAKKAQVRYNRAVADYAKDKTQSNARQKTDAQKALAEARSRLAESQKTLANLGIAYGNLDTLASSKKARDALTNLIAVEGKKLQALAVSREKNAAKLTAAKAKLTEAIKLRDDYAKAVADSARAFGSLIAESPGEGQALTAKDVVSQLSQKLVAIDAFRKNLAALKGQGLSDAALQQLVDAGVEAGSATAEALTQGGQAAVDQVNALTKAVGQQADALGTTYAKKFFQGGVDMAQGIVDGLASKQAALDQAADKLADDLVKRVKKKLGIKSPSTVMAGLGAYMGEGLAKGLDSSRSLVQSATDRLTKVARPKLGDLGVGITSGLAAGGVNVYVTNPIPETASESTTRIARRLAVLGPA
jgi:hypothetical protein